MDKTKALKTILFISAAGVLFSGFLSYREVFMGTCGVSLITCGANSTVAGIPACVIGFVMYSIVFIISFLGVKNKSQEEN